MFTFRPTFTVCQSDKVIKYERLLRRRTKLAQITEGVTTDSSDEDQPDIQPPDPYIQLPDQPEHLHHTADLSEINEGLPVTEVEILRAEVTDLECYRFRVMQTRRLKRLNREK